MTEWVLAVEGTEIGRHLAMILALIDTNDKQKNQEEKITKLSSVPIQN